LRDQVPHSRLDLEQSHLQDFLALNPLAPVLRSIAMRATSLIAEFVNARSAPWNLTSLRNWATYQHVALNGDLEARYLETMRRIELWRSGSRVI
jgi:hypothetical protein